jgi:NADPH:quinone reductase-like Zn-dependent oxidoreductase
MVRIYESAIIDAPARHVWDLLRDFNAHDRWHPAIASSHIEGALPADTVGAVRQFKLADGGMLREQLLQCSDAQMSLSYCLLESPVPLNDYVAHMRVRPVTDGDICYLEWWSTFNPPAHRLAEMVDLVRDGVYRAGIAALRDWFSGASPRASARATVVPVAQVQPDPDRVPDPYGVVVTRYGGPEVLVPEPITVVPPAVGEITVGQTYVGVNFIDIHCRTGHFRLLTPPAMPGMEAVGTVLAVGPDVAGLRTGDRVGYACAPVGAYCSHRTMRSDLVLRLPDLPDDVIAGHLLRGITASFLLHDVYALRPGQTVLVHAAAGGVGQILVQWAKHLGAEVIATASSDEKLRIARDLGADHLINYSHHDFADAVLELTSGRGADVIYDGVGQQTFVGSIRCAAICGHLISYGEASGPVGQWDIDSLVSKSLTISRPNYGHYTAQQSQTQMHAERFFRAVEQGHVRLQKPTCLSLRDAAEAHRMLEAHQTPGTLVLKV